MTSPFSCQQISAVIFHPSPPPYPFSIRHHFHQFEGNPSSFNPMETLLEYDLTLPDPERLFLYKRSRSQHGQPDTFRVGSDRQPFRLPRNQLTSRSEYFAAELGTTRNGRRRIAIHLRRIEPELFQLFVNYMTDELLDAENFGIYALYIFAHKYRVPLLKRQIIYKLLAEGDMPGIETVAFALNKLPADDGLLKLLLDKYIHLFTPETGVHDLEERNRYHEVPGFIDELLRRMAYRAQNVN
jgi:BTB/POZ domain